MRPRRRKVVGLWTILAISSLLTLSTSARSLGPPPTLPPDAVFQPFLPRYALDAVPTPTPPSAPVLRHLRASDAPETLEELQRAHVNPTPRPTATPRPKPKPTATPRPKLAGGPFKPWREFSANVMAARAYAQGVLSSTSWRCLDVLADRESRWRVHAGNRTSGAYGIPQALPGSKMSWAGDDWRDNATTQIKWMIHYIKGRYGNPCIALDHAYRTGWY